jgi:rod shape-determining protein MreD
MISGLAWIPVLLLLIVAQKTILDVFSFHLLSIELSLIFVVFAGFSMSIPKGGMLSLIAGFLVGVMTGTVTGLFMFVYFSLFCVSTLVSTRVYIEQPYFIMVFTIFCAFLEGMMLLVINRYILYASALYPTLQAVLPQILILGLVSPFFFRTFRKFEVLVHAKTAQPH